MSGYQRAGVTVNTTEEDKSGNGTNQEENHMASAYPGNFGSPLINAKGKAELEKKIVDQRYKRNKFLMKNMLDKALKNKDLFFDSEEYDSLVEMDKYLRKQLHKEPRKENFYPESFGTRFYKRCIGGECVSVKVPYTPQPPSYYRERKQTKVNTRKSNTRKSNTRKSNTRKRSNF